MLARQASRLIARRRCAWPHVPTRSFLEPAQTSRQESNDGINMDGHAPSTTTVKGEASSSADAPSVTASSSTGAHQSSFSDSDTAGAGPELLASFAAAAPATSSTPVASTSARPPTAAYRKLVQQEKKSRKTAESKSGTKGLAQDSSTSAPDGGTGDRRNKGKGRETDATASTSSTTEQSSPQLAEILPAEGPRSFAEYASRSTPVSNSFFVTQPSSDPSTSGTGSQTPSGAGKLALSTTPIRALPNTGSPSSSASSSDSNTIYASSGGGGSSSDQSNSPSDLGFLPFIPLQSVPVPQIRHPFNTHRFVSRLERDEAFSRPAAEALMRATKALLIHSEEEAVQSLVAKADVENQAYLFSAALSELRTEVQMTSRTDAIALRSLSSQLQREVDSLGQKMREDMANLKNDNQLDLNNRKEEANSDIAGIEQKILDLNSKFSLLMGDTRAVLEASKWIQTRRSIVMIAALAILAMAYISTKPGPPPPPPPKPPSAEDLGLKQIEEPDSAETGLFSWLGAAQPGSKDSSKREIAASTGVRTV